MDKDSKKEIEKPEIDETKIIVQGHVLIKDKNTDRVIINKRA